MAERDGGETCEPTELQKFAAEVLPNSRAMTPDEASDYNARLLAQFQPAASERDGETLSDERQTKLTREALSWFKKQHNAPCGDPKCDSVYCYAAQQIATVAALCGKLAEARADTGRLDWLDAEHERVDPVARLVVKKFHNRHGHEWADCAYSARREIDAARAASGKDKK